MNENKCLPGCSSVNIYQVIWEMFNCNKKYAQFSKWAKTWTKPLSYFIPWLGLREQTEKIHWMHGSNNWRIPSLLSWDPFLITHIHTLILVTLNLWFTLIDSYVRSRFDWPTDVSLLMISHEPVDLIMPYGCLWLQIVYSTIEVTDGAVRGTIKASMWMWVIKTPLTCISILMTSTLNPHLKCSLQFSVLQILLIASLNLEDL